MRMPSGSTSTRPATLTGRPSTFQQNKKCKTKVNYVFKIDPFDFKEGWENGVKVYKSTFPCAYWKCKKKFGKFKVTEVGVMNAVFRKSDCRLLIEICRQTTRIRIPVYPTRPISKSEYFPTSEFKLQTSEMTLMGWPEALLYKYFNTICHCTHLLCILYCHSSPKQKCVFKMQQHDFLHSYMVPRSTQVVKQKKVSIFRSNSLCQGYLSDRCILINKQKYWHIYKFMLLLVDLKTTLSLVFTCSFHTIHLSMYNTWRTFFSPISKRSQHHEKANKQRNLEVHSWLCNTAWIMKMNWT